MRRFHFTLFLGLAFLASAIVFFPKEATPPPQIQAAVTRPRLALNPRKKPRPPHLIPEAVAANLPPLPAASPPPHAPESLEKQEWITSQIHELKRLAGNADLGSVQKIVAELRSPVPEIREAALTATIDSGSRAAVPYLHQLAAEMNDIVQQRSIHEAIHLLSLPTMVETLDFDAKTFSQAR